MLPPLLVLAALASAPQDGSAIDLARLLAEMVDRRALCERPSPAYTAHQTSSYDRAEVAPDVEGWFANADSGHFVRVDERDGRREGVLLDAAGPGAIVRIWSSNPVGRLRIYLDGAVEPALDEPMRDLCAGALAVGAPLAAQRAGGFNLYLPIPFERRCVVTCDEPDRLTYHVAHRAYAAGTRVESFRAGDLARLRERIAAAGEALLHPRIDPRAEQRPFEVLLSAPGGASAVRSCSIDVDAPAGGAACIAELALELDTEPLDRRARLERALRQTVLSLAFDGEQTVRVPLGDFFGTAPGLEPFATFALEVRSSGRMLCRFPMPFRERATLRLESRSSERLLVRGSIAVAPYAWTERTLYFYAAWRHDEPLATSPPRDWRVLSVSGRGVYVGDMLSALNPVPDWWGDGDERIWVDGEAFPSHVGTDTAGTYGFAARAPERFEAPWHARSRCDGPQSLGWSSMCRTRALDAIPFESALAFDLELAHSASGAALACSATCWFYAERGAKVERAPLEPWVDLEVALHGQARWRAPGAIEGEDLEVLRASDGLAFAPQELAATDEGRWSGDRQLFVQATRAGDFVELALPVAEPGRREVELHLTRSWDYGVLRFALDGAPAGAELDTFNALAETRIGVPQPFVLGTFDLAPPRAVLRIEVAGANARSRPPHHYFGLDCVVLRPAK